MIDKEEPLFIMMMEHHSRKQSIRNNIWAYCLPQWSSVSLTDKCSIFKSWPDCLWIFARKKGANSKSYRVLYVCPLLTFSFFYLWVFKSLFKCVCVSFLIGRMLPLQCHLDLLGYTVSPLAQCYESAVGLPFHQLRVTCCWRQSETDR